MSGKIEEMMNHAKIAELLNKKKAEEENKHFGLCKTGKQVSDTLCFWVVS